MAQRLRLSMRRRPSAAPRLRPRALARSVLACAALALAFWGGGRGEALALLARERKGAKPRSLLSYGDYELVLLPRGRGGGFAAGVPRLELRKVPLPLVRLAGAASSVAGELSREELAAFPFTTENAASMELAFPRAGGRLHVGLEDPPVMLDVEDSQRSARAKYEQPVPGVGDVGAQLASSGEWEASLSRQVEGLGNLRGTVNSQLDWGVDVERSYPAYKDVAPTVTYGATQDGMWARTRLRGRGEHGVGWSYVVQNLPGRYAPADLLHEGSVEVPAGSGRLELRGAFDRRRLPEAPGRGSLAYHSAGGKRLEVAVDGSRYRLGAGTERVEASATIGRKEGPDAKGAKGAGGVLRGRPAELQLRVDKVSVSAHLGEGKPRVRVDAAL